MLVRCCSCGGSARIRYEKGYGDTPLSCSPKCFIRELHQFAPHSLHPQCRMEEFTERDLSMRSAYEVRFALWLSKQGMNWAYEPFKFYLSDGSAYVPDFYVSDVFTFFEVKGLWHPGAYRKFALFVKESGCRIYLITRPVMQRLKL